MVRLARYLIALSLVVLTGDRAWAAEPAADRSAASAVASASSLELLFGAVVPAAPSQLRAVAVSEDRVHLTWIDNAANEQEFSIERRRLTTSFSEISTEETNSTSESLRGLSSSTTYIFRVRARNASGFSAYSNEVTVTTPPSSFPCGPGGFGICLKNNRFRVLGSFRLPDGTMAQAHFVKLTDDSGYFYFINSANIEGIIKVLNGCPLNGFYWVFLGGITNVQVVVTVADTHGADPDSIFYANPQTNVFVTRTDTDALDSCP